MDFEDGEGKTVLTLYIQRGSDEGYVLHVEHLAAPLRVNGTLLRLTPAPHVDKSGVDFRRITAARKAAVKAEAELEAAVTAARANGDYLGSYRRRPRHVCSDCPGALRTPLRRAAKWCRNR